MRNIITICKKEIASFFNSLVAYIVLAVFLTGAGLFFWIFEGNVLQSGRAEMTNLFFIAPWMFLFLIPAITMRSFSEELKTGTFEFLSTKPVTDWQIILGKYLGACFLVMLALVPTIVYYFTLWTLAAPSEIEGREMELASSLIDNGPIIGAYLGLIGLGAAFAAIGILCSAITDNQVVSFISAAFLCFFFYFGFSFVSDLSLFRSINSAVAAIGILDHFESISLGVVDTRDVLYFITLISVALMLTRVVLTLRKK
jgi:ABC-2 type transport system permease protein